MLEKITAPISRFVNGILADGHDLEFESHRSPKSREPKDFVFCTTKAGAEAVERGYNRIRAQLHLSPPQGQKPRLIRNIVINSN